MTRRPALRLVTMSVGLAFVSVGATAHAQEPAPAEAKPADSKIAEAKQLFERGRAKYDLGDYDGAIELWTSSYELLVNQDGTVEMQDAIVYNVTRAQRSAFEI